MDKFEKRVQDAKEDYRPSDGFVDRTMEEVKKHKIHRRRFSLKLWAPAAAGAIAVVAIAIIFVPKPAQNEAVNGTVANAQKPAAAKPSASPAAISDGTDDASLASDLNNVQSAIAQTGSDQSNTDNAVNDNQQEISIPTNEE